MKEGNKSVTLQKINILKSSNGGTEEQKTYTENKWPSGKNKSFFINHIKCKWNKLLNQKA